MEVTGKQAILPHFARTRQGKTDAGTGTRQRVHPDAPTVGFDNGFRKVKSQPGAFRLADSLIRTVEAVEDIGDIGGINPGSLVADGDDHLFGTNLPADTDLAPGEYLMEFEIRLETTWLMRFSSARMTGNLAGKSTTKV